MTALTGANVYACNVLIPLGVVVYVVLGGLRATFLSDYTHTVVLMLIILYFSLTAFATSGKLGSPGAVYDLLVEAAKETPVEGNQNGSYVTLKSNFGLIFGVINVCANSGTVFLDQGYWQRAIASRPSTAMRGYFLGGLAWFAVPFCFATTLGMTALALRHDPQFPTYPYILSDDQIGAGLPAPAGAYALLGTGGAVAMLLVLFMAVTSALSSELIAVSSILTFDVYKIYIDPTASGAKLVRLSHYGIVFWAVVCTAGASLWNGIGLNLGWLYNFMGIIIGPAVLPVFYAVTWSKQPWIAMILAPILGLCGGVTAWLVTAATLNDGVISIATTGSLYPQLAGNLASIMLGFIISTTISLIMPDNFDFDTTRAINMPAGTISTVPVKEKELEEDVSPTPEKAVSENGSDLKEGEILAIEEDVEDPEKLKRAVKTASIAGVVVTLIMIVIVPIPLFLSHYIFSKGFFTFWIILGMLWAWVATFITVVLPIYESWNSMAKVSAGIWADITGKRLANRAD